MTSPRQRLAVRVVATPMLFTALAGDFWRDLIGWWGWGVLAAALIAAGVVLLVRLRRSIAWPGLPRTLALFLFWIVISLAWSAYPLASGIGIVAQLAQTAAAFFLALCLSWEELLRALGDALRWIIGLSLVFELIVSLFVRHHILPFWVDYGSGHLPNAYYWSRDLLFHGGQIQGIVGNSNLLAMCVLLALIVFGVQLADGRVRRTWGIFWLVLAAVCFVLTRSSTVIIATVVTAAALGFALWARRAGEEHRTRVYVTAAAVLLAAVATVVISWDRITELLGKSEDLTGRTKIWDAVIGLAQQRPAFGWGWVSYWAPWAKPFKDLAVRHHVEYLQAHEAWLDVWLQVGIVGLVIFAVLVATTLWRLWFIAVDRPRFSPASHEPFTALSLMPLLVLAAYLAQSLAESRMLIEAGWILLVVFTVKSKFGQLRSVP